MGSYSVLTVHIQANPSIPLRKHTYSIILKISSPKTANFQMKVRTFRIPAQNLDCGYSLEPPC